MSEQTVTTEHTARVDYVPGRYVYRPACSCGWVYGKGYVAEHAAQLLADEHASGRL